VTLETRVVAPLSPVSAMKGMALWTLIPVLEIEGEHFRNIVFPREALLDAVEHASMASNTP
jgi:hypothetical protein